MLVALASLNQIWENKEANLDACKGLLSKSKTYGVDLIIFPEMTLTGFSTNVSVTGESKDVSPTVESFVKLCKEFGIGVIFGVTFLEKAKGTNNALFLDKSGATLGSYQKIHPFSLSGEDKCFTAGNKIVYVDFESLVIGITICYDLRFPELYSALGAKAELIVNIANWPTTRIDHWTTLLRARAIENQVYLAGVNRIGVDGNELCYTRSSILVDPNGQLLEPTYTEGDLDVYELDKASLLDHRREFSTTQDRVPQLYKNLL
jgi:omega-amidase